MANDAALMVPTSHDALTDVTLGELDAWRYAGLARLMWASHDPKGKAVGGLFVQFSELPPGGSENPYRIVKHARAQRLRLLGKVPCAVCAKVPVNPEAGQDTCSVCQGSPW